MLENYSTTWGGAGNLIIPAADIGDIHEELWPLVEIFDADMWAAYVNTPRGHELADPDGFRNWLNREARKWSRKYGGGIARARELLTAEHMMSDIIGGWPPPERLVKELEQRTGPATEHDRFEFGIFRAGGKPGQRLVDVCDLQPLPEIIRVLAIHGLPISLQLVIATRFGALAPSHARRLTEAGVIIETVRVEDVGLDFLLRSSWFDSRSRGMWSVHRTLAGQPTPAVIREDLLKTTPLALSSIGCVRMSRWYGDQDRSPLVIIVGGHVDDFAYALALDRCGVPAVWLPEEFVGVHDPLSDEVFNSLAACLSAHEFDDRPKTIQSLSGSVETLNATSDRLRATVWGSDLVFAIGDKIPIPPHRVPVLVDPECFDDLLEEPFIDDTMACGVPAAIPSRVRSVDPWKLTWWAEVNDPLHPLPGRASLNGLVVADLHSWRAIARSGRDGIAYFSHTMGFSPAGASVGQVAERPRLRFPSVSTIWEELLIHGGFQVQESPAGRFRGMTTRLWGGLEQLAEDLTNPNRLSLLRSWLSTEKSGVSPGVFTSARRRFLSFEDCIKAGALSPDETRALLDSYLERDILRRGLILKCGRCLHFDWYSLDDVGQSFRCHRCRTPTMITQSAWRGGPEPSAYYDLAEVVLQALKGNVEVPVRALARLKEGSASFVETPELEVVNEQGDKLEVDLLAIVDGRIVIGEAKTGDALQRTKSDEVQWLIRFEQVARGATADEVVFATAAASWRSATSSRIRDRFKSGKPLVRILGNC